MVGVHGNQDRMIKQVLADAAWRFAPRLMIEQHLRRRKSGLEPELWLVDQLVRPDEVAVDVGANRGVWAVQMARYARRVEAFEPNPMCVRDLQRVVGARVRINAVALSDVAGDTRLRFDPDNTGIATIEAANTLRNNAGISRVVETPVTTASLDSFHLTGVGLIKIDVEGHEEAVLRGAQETLRRERPNLVIETEDRHNPGAPGRVEESLRALGYGAFVLREGALISTDAARERGARLGDANDVNNFVFVWPARGIGRGS
jgi:FkbM family methyltransferase